MKNFAKLALIGSGLLLSVNAISGTASYKNEKTSCYVFNSNKLIKQGSCTYSGISGGNGYGAFQKADFTIKGYGKISMVDSASSEEGFDPNGSGELINAKYVVELDGKKAKQQYRNLKTLKILSSTETGRATQDWLDKGNAQGWKNMGKPSFLKCYKQTNSSLELCYVDNIPS